MGKAGEEGGYAQVGERGGTRRRMEGRVRAGGRATLGPPLQRRPERELGLCKTRTHDAARRVATVFEKLHCLIRTYLPAGRRKPHDKRLNPYGNFAEVSEQEGRASLVN